MKLLSSLGAFTTSNFNKRSESGLTTKYISSCDGSYYCRTNWSIAVSCIVTVLACCWLSVRTNVSHPINKGRMRTLECLVYYIRVLVTERVFFVVLVLSFPEFMLAYALRQRCMAKHYAKQFNTSRSVGFFMIMGGFYHFIEGSKGLEPCCMVPPHMMADQITLRDLSLPPAEEIDDKSKGQPLLKSLVLIQMGWFLLQCLVRVTATSASTNLEFMRLTKLEVLTLGYIVVTGWIYWAWHDKPRNISRPIGVAKDPSPSSHYKFDGKTLPEKLCDIILGHRDHHIDMTKMERAPMFYSGIHATERAVEPGILALLVGFCFAGINCIAWSYPTQSFVESILWRTFSPAIFGLCGLGVVIILPYFLIKGSYFTSEPWREKMRKAFLFCVVLYMTARLGSILLAFLDLQSLPPPAYETVYWTTLIPHI